MGVCIMKQNLLRYYVSLLRTNKDTQVSSERKEQCVTALHNAIRTMCFSRKNKICGENFSNLDFGNIPLNGIKFSIDGSAPCSFGGSTLHEWNLYSGHRYPVMSAVFSGNGKYIITLDEEGEVIVWNVENRIIHNQYSIGVYQNQPDFPISTYSAIISQNGNFFATSCKYVSEQNIYLYGRKHITTEIIEIWQTSTGNHHPIPQKYEWESFSPVMVFTHDERYLLTGYHDHRAVMWDTSNGDFVRAFVGHEKGITAVGFSVDDTLCITGSADNTAKIWNSKTGECIQTLKKNGHLNSITAVAISKDKSYYLTGDEEGTAKLWTSDGKCKYTWDNYKSGIIKVCFTSNCRQCATISNDNTIRLWSIETYNLIISTEWMDDKAYSLSLFNTSDIFDRNYLFLYDNGFMIKELESNLIIYDFKYHNCYAKRFSISKNYFFIVCGKNHVMLFDKLLKKEIFNLDISNKFGDLENLDISFDEQYFVTCFRNSNIIIIYNMNTKRPIRIIDNCSNIVNVSFVPNHDWLFVLLSDGIGKCIDVKTGDCICVFDGSKYKSKSTIHSSVINISHDGEYCFCCYSRGKFVLWKFGSRKPIHIFEFENVDPPFFLSVSSKYCAIIDERLRIWNIKDERYIQKVGSGKISMFHFLGDGDYYVIGWDNSHSGWDDSYYNADRKVNVIVKLHKSETGELIKIFRTEKLLFGSIKWQFPYYFCFNDNYVDVYELDCFSSEDEIMSNYIGRFYMIDDLNVKGCDFSNIDADDIIKEILSQYGGNL